MRNIVAIERRRALATDLIRPLAQTTIAAGDVLFLDVRSDGSDRVEAGHYRFFDFVKVGVPFTLVALVTTVLLVPWLLPF